MNVVPLAHYAIRDTVAVLAALLEKAERGEIVGMALCFRDRKGHEDCCLTGNFARNPDRAVAAALRLSVRVANSQGDYDYPP